MKYIFIDTSTPWIFTSVIDENDTNEIYTSIDFGDSQKDQWMHLHFRSLIEKKIITLEEENFQLLLGRGPGSFTSLRVAFMYMSIISDYYKIPCRTFFSLSFFHAGFHLTNDEPLFIQTNKNLFYAIIPNSKKGELTGVHCKDIEDIGHDFCFADIPAKQIEPYRINPSDQNSLFKTNHFWEEPYTIRTNNKATPHDQSLSTKNFDWQRANLFLMKHLQNKTFNSQFSPFYGHTLKFIKKQSSNEKPDKKIFK